MKKEKLLILILLLILVSCNQKDLKSPLIDNLIKGDTLTFLAEFADCGEWGGHIEKIYLTKKENDLYVGLYKDSDSCQTDPNDTRIKIFERSQKLTPANKNEIVNYINKFIIVSNTKSNAISNSCNFFEIMNKDTAIGYRNYGMGWNEFKIMRDRIFK